LQNGFNILNSHTPITVAIVNLPNALTSSLVGMQDVFHIANQFCIGSEEHRFFDIVFVHIDDAVQNFHSSVVFKSKRAERSQTFDIVIIPPIIDDSNGIDVPPLLSEWLHHMYAKGSYICSVCVGAYVLAKAQLLDNKKATTHWIVEEQMEKEFPLIKLDVDKIIIEDQNIITAGGVSAYIDLALYLIRKFISIETAYQCANYLVVDAGRTSQKHYKNLAGAYTGEETDLKDLLMWIDRNIHYPITLADLAKQLHVSERTLMRRFAKEIGVLPTRYLQNIRVQKAKELIINSNRSFEHITFDVGYEDISSFRRLFKKMTGLSPGEYRNIFMVKQS